MYRLHSQIIPFNIRNVCVQSPHAMVAVVLCRMHPAQMAQQRTSGLARAASVGVPHNWGYDDDALLAALVVEYNMNWHFIADTCSSTCVLQVGPK